MIDLLATEPHYWAHLRSIWRALPEDLKGTAYCGKCKWNSPPSELQRGFPKHRSTVLVASYQDHRTISNRRGRTILVEHGAGQRYSGVDNGSYAGGRGRDRVLAFICPSEWVAQANRERYPNAPSYVVGSPILDARLVRGPVPAPKPEKVVAFSFHSDLDLVPETRSALPHYRNDLGLVIARLQVTLGWEVLGHGHPRLFRDRKHDLEGLWRSCGVEVVWEFSEVCERASVYVVDNSSTAMEFAATTGPVVLLNAPWYRREVEHGLMFWSHRPGYTVDGPEHVVEAIRLAHAESPRAHLHRRECVAFAYHSLDGKASERAAQAIAEVMCSLSKDRPF